MPTQEEVLEVIKKRGWATYTMLREHLGIKYRGNSVLPERLKSLRNKGLIKKIQTDIGVVFVACYA